jgi:hypothetical protein
LKKIAGKINKALKIIRTEGFMEFTWKLTRRIVYDMINSIQARLITNERFSRLKTRNKIHFTEKRIMHDIQMKNERIKIERLFADIKAEILGLKNK